MTDRFYPKPGRFFAKQSPDRPLFQGDIFGGGFGAWWRHPAAVTAIMAGQPLPTDPASPSLQELLTNVLVKSNGHVILLPHPCEYSETEKGSTHRFRVVAPIFPLDRNATVDAGLVREGKTGHAIWIPRWTPNGPQDFYADLRFTTSIDAAFITRTSRVASLTSSAWVAVVDKLSRYYVGVPLDTAAFSVENAHLHPDVP